MSYYAVKNKKGETICYISYYEWFNGNGKQFVNKDGSVYTGGFAQHGKLTMEVTDEAIGGHGRGRSNRNVNQPSVAAMTEETESVELDEIDQDHGGGQPAEEKQVENKDGGPDDVMNVPEEEDVKESKKEEKGKKKGKKRGKKKEQERLRK